MEFCIDKCIVIYCNKLQCNCKKYDLTVIVIINQCNNCKCANHVIDYHILHRVKYVIVILNSYKKCKCAIGPCHVLQYFTVLNMLL